MIINFSAVALNVQISNYSIISEKLNIFTFPQIDNYNPDFKVSLFFRPGHYDLCYINSWPNLENEK
jgi:hypothetical protein